MKKIKKMVSKNTMNTKTKKTEDYLKEPYARILIPESEGGYSAEILEFPGCYSFGNTADEAMANLDDAAFNWIEAALAQGQFIPEPASVNEPSGKILLRLPRNLHKKAIQMAARERISVNTFLVDAVSARVGAQELYNRLLDELKSRVSQANTSQVTVFVQNLGLPLNPNELRMLSSKANTNDRPN